MILPNFAQIKRDYKSESIKSRKNFWIAYLEWSRHEYFIQYGQQIWQSKYESITLGINLGFVIYFKTFNISFVAGLEIRIFYNYRNP